MESKFGTEVILINLYQYNAERLTKISPISQNSPKTSKKPENGSSASGVWIVPKNNGYF